MACQESRQHSQLAFYSNTALHDGGKALSVRRIHLRTLSAAPQIRTRIMCRRLRRHWPSAEIVLVPWCGAVSLASAENLDAMGMDEVAFRLHSVVEPSAPSKPAGLEEDRVRGSLCRPRKQMQQPPDA